MTKQPILPDKKNTKLITVNKIFKGGQKSKFPIVGIGSSAGGLEALESFFKNIPVNTGMAFVLIQHLDPDHKGMMPELIQRITKMKVVPVTDRLAVKKNCIYVIPPNTAMSIFHGALHLFVPVETRGLRLPVDFFLNSLADDLRENAVGIILSGMGSDGSFGVKVIKENGGIVMVQDPADAKFDSMPLHALDSVSVDVQAPANQLPKKLLALNGYPVLANEGSHFKEGSSSLEKINILLRSQTGNDFSQYKKNTLYRRIERRMGIHQLSKIELYLRYLQQNPAEVDILFKELLIGVTSFFRDPAVWKKLKEVVLPDLFSRLPSGHVLRAWIPGCSTGEEAYSLAIILKEAAVKSAPDKHFIFQLFATDLDSSAINKARFGVYPANIIADVSPERLKLFFVKTGEQYRVNSTIREMVVFAPHNVIKDPPFTKLDIISCRNMLIYMEAELQKKLMTLFQYSLFQNGILILGSAETNGASSELFKVVESKLRIYQRSGADKKAMLFNVTDSYLGTTKNKAKKQNIMVKISGSAINYFY